jgi:hypothetical protein
LPSGKDKFIILPLMRKTGRSDRILIARLRL